MAGVYNLISLAVMCVSTYIIGRSCGGSRVAASLSVLVLLTVPMIQFQTFSNYIDLLGELLNGIRRVLSPSSAADPGRGAEVAPMA